MSALPRFSGAFGRDEARHLITRAAYGASPRDIEEAASIGLGPCLDALLEGQFRPRLDETAIARMERSRPSSFEQLRARFLMRAILGGDVLRSRLTLVLHDHFATAFRKVRSLDFMLLHLETLRRGALGSLRELILALCRDPAMLIWLDGAGSTRARPNENLARELLELFTLGRGAYGEDDVKAAARVLTGRRVDAAGTRLDENDRDDREQRLLGGRARGDEQLIDLILAQDVAAPFLAEKLARPFLGSEAAAAARGDLGSSLQAACFDLGHFLRDLLGSELFFARTSRRRSIRSPLEFVIGAMRALEARGRATGLAAAAAAMGQSFGDPPSVAGWPEGRAWISTATIAARQRFAAAIGEGRSGPHALRTALAQDTSAADLAFAVLGGPATAVADGGELFTRAARLLTHPEAQLI